MTCLPFTWLLNPGYGVKTASVLAQLFSVPNTQLSQEGTHTPPHHHNKNMEASILYFHTHCIRSKPTMWLSQHSSKKTVTLYLDCSLVAGSHDDLHLEKERMKRKWPLQPPSHSWPLAACLSPLLYICSPEYVSPFSSAPWRGSA